ELCELAPLTPRFEHVCADVTRDAAQPRLDGALASIRWHRAVCAQQRLLRGLVGVGLRAEERDAQAAEHVSVLARARGQRLAVLASLHEGSDRIGAELVGHGGECTSLHFATHVWR